MRHIFSPIDQCCTFCGEELDEDNAEGICTVRGDGLQPTAPPGDIDKAVSYRCMPIAPLLCWRFDQGARAFPKWVLEYLTFQHDGKVEFFAPENGPNCTLDPGDWVVLFDADEMLVTVYPQHVFEAQFKCVFQ